MSKYNAEVISRSVAARRAMARLTQQELADKAGVSVSTVRVLEQKGKSPTAENFCRIAEALDCSLDDLLRLPQ